MINNFPKAFYKLNGNALDSSGNGNDGTLSGFGPVAEYHFDGDATDETGSYNGTPTDITYATGVSGQAAVFNGSSSIVTASIPAQSALSVSLWVYKNRLDQTEGSFYLSDGAVQCRIFGVSFFEFDYVPGEVGNIQAPATLGWQHIVITHSDGVMKIYKDSVLMAQSTQAFQLSTTGTWTVGIGSLGTWYYFSGMIDDLRIFDYAISEAEISALYNRPQEPSYWVDGVSGKALSFDGDGSIVTMGSYTHSTEQITMTTWVQRNSGTGVWFDLFDAGSGVQFESYGAIDTAVWVYPTVGSPENFGFGNVLSTSEFTHVAVVVDFTNGDYRGYINGVLTVSGTKGKALKKPTAVIPHLGVGTWAGSIDDVRIFDYALTEYEIQFIYENPETNLPYQLQQGLQLHILSPDDELIYLLDSNTQKGRVLRAEPTFIKNGGLDTLKFTIDRFTDLPFFSGMRVALYFNGVKKCVGFSNVNPEPESNNPELEVECSGYYKKLESIFIDTTYSSTTLAAILASIGSTYFADADIVYDASLIADCPATVVSSLEFADKSLLDCVDQILSIANASYLTDQYYWYIDENRKFNFKLTSDDVMDTYFEGYDFSAPESENLDTVINKVLIYRTSLGGATVSLVATYEDTDSQAKYGEKANKITVPNYADDTTIQNIAQSILKRYAEPQKRIQLKDSLIDNTIPFGFYGLSLKPEDKWVIASECDDLLGWNVSALINTTVTLDTTNPFTGKRCFKFVTGAGSNGEYIEFVLPVRIVNPKLLRAYLYYATNVDEINILFTDSIGNEILLETNQANNLAADQWLKYEKDSLAEIIAETYEVDLGLGAGVEDYEIDLGSGLDTYDITYVEGDLMVDLYKVRVQFLTNNVRTFYLDRLDALARTWSYSKLLLEEAKYLFENRYVEGEFAFGEKDTTLIDETKKLAEDGKVALNIFSK